MKKWRTASNFQELKTINRDKPQDDLDVRINVQEFLNQIL